MTSKKFVFLLMISVLCFSIFSVPFNAEADEVGDLFDYYVKQLPSGKVTMKISEQPDSTGFFKDVYLEAKDVAVDNLRIDSAFVSVSGLQLNPPSEWANDKENVKFDSFQSASLNVNISENSINNALRNKDFRFEADDREFILHNISVNITANGIKMTGSIQENDTSNLRSYAAAWLLGAAANDYPIEINSKLRIENGKEIWLDNPTVEKSNYAQLDSYIERYITNRNEPILDLANFDLSKTPITLDNVAFKDGSLSTSTNTLPKDLEGEGVFEYTSGKETTDDESKKSNNSSSSGCNAGVGAITFIVLAYVISKKR